MPCWYPSRHQGSAQLSACQKVIADVFPQPATPDGSITASDALCIFQKAFGLPSCLDSVSPSNEAPMANAGSDQSVDAGVIVVLSGTASDPDGGIVSNMWEQTGGTTVSLAGVDSLTAMFTAPDVSVDETLTFRLTATDNDGAQASDEVTVTVLQVNQPADPNQFASVSAGGSHTCRLRESGAVECWGRDSEGQSTPPAATFISVSAGGSHTCGLRGSGAMACWGRDSEGQSTPPAATFISVSAGGSHTCGLRESGAVECWGRDGSGQSTPPAGTFISVSGGGFHTCGLRESGAVECWGRDGSGQSTPPAGTFISVSAGVWHTCGLRETGAVECWGHDDSGQSTPPAGTFISVSGGNLHTCGARDSGEVTCWGDDAWDLSTSPPGTFTSVSAGSYHTCGVLREEKGAVECWGLDNNGQATPPNPVYQPPMVNAGVDQSVEAGTEVILTGTASDPDGSIVSYMWEQTGGTTVSLAGADSLTAMFTAPDVSVDETLDLPAYRYRRRRRHRA